jgi:hypothetical protein
MMMVPKSGFGIHAHAHTDNWWRRQHNDAVAHGWRGGRGFVQTPVIPQPPGSILANVTSVAVMVFARVAQ